MASNQTTLMGFEGQLFYGAAGSTGATQITEATDVSIKCDLSYGSTMPRGAGVNLPIKTERPTALNWSCDFTLLNNPNDATIAALRTAATSGGGVALRMKDFASGKGYDGDVSVTVENGQPLNGEQTLKFTASPRRDFGREPQLYV